MVKQRIARVAEKVMTYCCLNWMCPHYDPISSYRPNEETVLFMPISFRPRVIRAEYWQGSKKAVLRRTAKKLHSTGRKERRCEVSHDVRAHEVETWLRDHGRWRTGGPSISHRTSMFYTGKWLAACVLRRGGASTYEPHISRHRRRRLWIVYPVPGTKRPKRLEEVQNVQVSNQFGMAYAKGMLKPWWLWQFFFSKVLCSYHEEEKLLWNIEEVIWTGSLNELLDGGGKTSQNEVSLPKISSSVN